MHGASKIIDTFETYQVAMSESSEGSSSEVNSPVSLAEAKEKSQEATKQWRILT
jgi:hypothetical protein